MQAANCHVISEMFEFVYIVPYKLLFPQTVLVEKDRPLEERRAVV